MGEQLKNGSYDPFSFKYLLIALVAALGLPLMHVFIGISTYLF